MNGLVKANTVVVTRERYQTALSSSDSTMHRLDASSEVREMDALRARVADLERQLEDLSGTHARQETEAYERGVREGEQAAVKTIQKDHNEHIGLLKHGIERAVARFDETLDALMPLSLDVAESALSCVIDRPSHYAHLITQTVERQLRYLAADTVLSIDVSSHDFPASAALENGLAGIQSRHGLTVTAKATADAGTCILHLTLGRIDASLTTQRQRLAAIFTELRNDD
ncbi:hypothetical protein GCM10007901_15930 [Dyella acidisoli]|uniref:Flagellar assembly protein FliH/Type III secretion system HrpE domain-containing protein n=2 Tax=Dyella acidisoli TaxID=1867834 RepID=A0ABQ5XNS0_9GAMM|nr:hypothetical protein GCM10007901_15930 [Dyella acidisoli]